MTWIEPRFSRQKVNQAGARYADPRASAQERAEALVVINNWRSAHSFPLNTLQMNLRGVAANHDPDPTVARRIKRLPSIRQKLRLIEGMKLSRMQDIGGARAVVQDVDTVHRMADFYRAKSRVKHRLIRDDFYTFTPPASGYRCVHLVFAYSSDRNPAYNGLRIELQIRSRLQHAWATAVETVGTFTEQALKSSLGDPVWLRFFALMSASIAIRERTLVALRRAFPNYFADTRAFVDAVQEAIA